MTVGSQFTKVCVALIIGLLLQGCAKRDETTVKAFNDQYQRALETEQQALAASYVYQLEETPESEAIRRVMKNIRGASAADLQKALESERDRARYIDAFEEDIGSLRTSLSELSSRANAIRDEEIRAAALDVYKQFAETFDSANSLAATQRDRSKFVQHFLTSVIERRPLPSLSEIDAINNQLQQHRERMLQIANRHELAFGTFKGVAERKLGLKL